MLRGDRDDHQGQAGPRGPAQLLPGPAQVTGVRCVLLQAALSRHQGKGVPGDGARRSRGCVRL